MTMLGRSWARSARAKCQYQAQCQVQCTHSLPVQLEQLRLELTNPDAVYPEYAERKFHAYDGGNLDWLAVWEVEPATAATAVRILRPDTLGPDEATAIMRQSFSHSVQASLRCACPSSLASVCVLLLSAWHTASMSARQER